MIVGSAVLVFTYARFSQFWTVPELLPTTPPVMRLEKTPPLTVQRPIKAPAAFSPQMPPARLSPLTVPEKLHPVIVPRFTPAMPPSCVALPSGLTTPSTVTLRTTPLASMMPNRPAGETLELISSPEMVWPPPSKVPPKLAAGRSDAPDREISRSR